MAKNRYVNTHFWKDTYIINLDPIEKLLFIYFLTNPAANISGVYEIAIREVALDTGIDQEMIQKILKRFSRDKKIYFHEGYIIIVNFHKHQNQGSDKIISGIKNNLSILPDIIKKFISEQLKGIYTLSYLNLTEPNINKNKSNISETEGFLKTEDQKQKSKSNEDTHEYNIEFQKFWKLYPRKDGNKKEAEELFLNEHIHDYSKFFEAVRNYAADCENRDIKYIKYPVSFIPLWKDFL